MAGGGTHELLLVLSRSGRPAPGLPALRGGFVVSQFGRSGGGEGRGTSPRGAGNRAGGVRVSSPPRRAAPRVGAVNRPVPARGEPPGPAPSASSPGLRGGGAWGLGRGLGGARARTALWARVAAGVEPGAGTRLPAAGEGGRRSAGAARESLASTPQLWAQGGRLGVSRGRAGADGPR